MDLWGEGRDVGRAAVFRMGEFVMLVIVNKQEGGKVGEWISE